MMVGNTLLWLSNFDHTQPTSRCYNTASAFRAHRTPHRESLCHDACGCGAMGEIPAAASSVSALELVSGAEMFRLLVVAITGGENGAVDTLESAIKLF